MEKRRFADGEETDPDLESGVRSGPNPNIDDDTRQRAAEYVRGATKPAVVASSLPAVVASSLPAVVRRGESEPAKPTSFKEAFAGARKAGDKTFEWNGKKYTTEMASAKSTAPAPKAPASASAAPKTSAGDFQRSDKAKPKYQSLQDRAADYEAKRKESGVGMYGTRKSTPEPRGITKIDKGSMEPSGMGSIRTKKPRGGEDYAKGGSVKAKGWGMARGARAAKIV